MQALGEVDLQAVAILASAIGTMLATIVLVAVTWVLAKETKRLADATSAPHVVVTLDPSPWSILHTNLVLHNSGTGPAYDVEATFDPPLSITRNGEESPMPVRGLSVLKPNQSFAVFLKGFEDLDDQVFRVSVSWLRSPDAGVREGHAYTLDLRRDYKNWGQLGGAPPEIQVSRDLKKIRENFERLVSGFSRLNVDVHDARERLKERQKLERAWRKQRSADEQ